MTTLNVYLHFKGNCEKAFDFYKSIFGGEYEFKGRYKDISEEAREIFPYCADEQNGPIEGGHNLSQRVTSKSPPDLEFKSKQSYYFACVCLTF